MHKAIIEVGILKEFFKFSSKIVNEFRMRITPDGWETDFVDPTNTMLASIRIFFATFEYYTLDPELGEGIEIGVDVNRIADILTIFKDRELAEVSLKVSKIGEKFVGERIDIKVQNLTYSCSLIDPSAIRRPPKIDIIDKVIDGSETEGAKLTISLSELRDIIKTAPSEYDKLLIHCKPREEAYIFNGVEKTDIVDFEAAKETIAMYRIEYLEPLFTLRSARSLEIYLVEDQPCVILPDARFTLRYAIAPYIPEDKTEYLPSEIEPEWRIPLSEEMLKVYSKPLKTIEPYFLVIDEKHLYFVEAVGVGEKYAVTAYVEIEYPVPTQVEARGTYDLFSDFKTIVGKSKEITLNERDGKLYAGEVEVGKRSELTVRIPEPEGNKYYIQTKDLFELAKIPDINIALKCEKEKLAEFVAFIEEREDPEGSAVSETYCPSDLIRIFKIPKRYVIGYWAEVWCTAEIGSPVFIRFWTKKEHALLTYISDIVRDREVALIDEVKRQLRIIKEPPVFAEIEAFIEEASAKLTEFDGEQPESKLNRLEMIGRRLRSTTYIRRSIWAQSEEPISGYNRLIEQAKKFLEELNALGYEDKIKEYLERLATVKGWTVKRDALRGKLNTLSVRIESIRKRIENNIEWAKHNLDIFKRDFEEAKDIIEHFGVICKAVARVYDKLKFKKVKAEREYDQEALKECLKDYAECNLAKLREDAAESISVAYWAKMLTKAFKELPGLWKEEIVGRFKEFYDMMHKPSVDALFMELAAEAEKYKPPVKPPVKLEEMPYIYKSPRPLTAMAFPQFFRTLEEEGIKYVLSEDMFEIGTDKPIPINFVEELELKLTKTRDVMSLKEFADYFKVSVEDAARSVVEASREDLLHDVREAIKGTKTFNKYMVESSADAILEEAKRYKPEKIPTPEDRVAELKKELESIRKTYESAEKVRDKAETEENLNEFGVAVKVLESSLKKIDDIIEKADAIYKKFGLVAASTLSSEASILKGKISSLKDELESKINRLVSKMEEYKVVEDNLWACEAVKRILDEIKWKSLPPERTAHQEFFKSALEAFSTCDKKKIKNHFALLAERYELIEIAKAIQDVETVSRDLWDSRHRRFYDFMFKESVEKFYNAIKEKKAEIKPPKPPVKPYPTELKDYAAILLSVQPLIEKGWHPVAVDFVDENIQLYNPEAPYRKRHRYKKMTKKELEFLKAISDALTMVEEKSRLPLIASHLVMYSDILIPLEQALKGYPELLDRVKEIKAKPPLEEIKKRVEELGKQVFHLVDRLKFLQTAKATEEVIEEAGKIKSECEAKKPEIDELLDKIPEKTELYEKAYDVWSSVRTCIDKAGRLEKEAKEWMERMPELRKRILSEISRLESEYDIKIPEGDVHIFVTDLLKELRKIPEEQWDKRIFGAVKEFVEEQRKKIVEVIPAAERARLKGIIGAEISIQQMRMNVKPPAEERRAFEEKLLKELEKVKKDERAKYIEDKVREWFLEKAGEWRAIPKPPGVPVEKPPTPPPPEVVKIQAEDVAKKLIAELSTELGLARMSRSEVEGVVQEKLEDINRLAEDVAKGKMPEEEAIKQIKEVAKQIIEKLPPPPPPPRVKIAYRRFLLARLFRVTPDDLRTVAENIDKFPTEEVVRAVRESLDARLTRANVDRALELFTNPDFLKIAEYVGLRAEVETKADEARKLKEMFEATVSPARLNVMVKLLASNIERGLFTFRPDDVCKIAPFINLADPELVSKLREVIRTMREPERPIPAKRFHELTEHECFRRLVEVL